MVHVKVQKCYSMFTYNVPECKKKERISRDFLYRNEIWEWTNVQEYVLLCVCGPENLS